MNKAITTQIYETDDYSMFLPHPKQPPERVTASRSELKRSMTAHGWLDAAAMHVTTVGGDGCPDPPKGKMYIKNGNRRFTTAKELGLPVKYIVDNTPITLTAANEQLKFNMKHYVSSMATDNEHYQELLTFTAQTGLPLRPSATLLSGGFGNSGNGTAAKLKSGRFEVTVAGRGIAWEVYDMVEAILPYFPKVRTRCPMAALQRAFAAPGFDQDRLKSKVCQQHGKWDLKANAHQYLILFEEIYNWRVSPSDKFPLVVECERVEAKAHAAAKRAAKEDELVPE